MDATKTKLSFPLISSPYKLDGANADKCDVENGFVLCFIEKKNCAQNVSSDRVPGSSVEPRAENPSYLLHISSTYNNLVCSYICTYIAACILRYNGEKWNSVACVWLRCNLFIHRSPHMMLLQLGSALCHSSLSPSFRCLKEIRPWKTFLPPLSLRPHPFAGIVKHVTNHLVETILWCDIKSISH